MLAVVPLSTTSPAYMLTPLSQVSAITERSWLIRMKERSRSLRSRSMSSRICACTMTSSAVVGSSPITSLGLHASAMAIMARWRMPPESWWEVHDALLADAHQVVELLDAHHGLGLGKALVQLDGLGDLLARLAHRVQGVHRPLEDDADLLPADLAHAVLGALGQVAAVEEHVAGDDAPVLGQQLED